MTPAPVGITVLGATGTIGVNTLDVVARHRERYRIVALSGHKQVERLLNQCRQFRPEFAVMSDTSAASRLESALREEGLPTRVLSGDQALSDCATHPDVDIVMAGIVGAAGLVPTLSAVRAGKRVLIANKEPLVMLGGIFMEEARAHNATLLPIDSEHNAIFQCLPATDDPASALAQRGIRRIVLTGSGGPFRNRRFEDLATVTPDQACAHPNWVMGRKISVDSATMMNKGLEIIEACWLFNASPGQIEVVVHPQSIVHSLVEYVDGSMLAQLGSPDMRIPIAHALAWPDRMESGARSVDLLQLAQLDFEAPSYETFPCLRLSEQAARRGGSAPAILNAANEVAVAAFLDERLQFTDIPRVIEHVLEQVPVQDELDLDTVLSIDAEARACAEAWIGRNPFQAGFSNVAAGTKS